MEASSARNGIGLVKLMGRQSGFIAMQASMASGGVGGRGKREGERERGVYGGRERGGGIWGGVWGSMHAGSVDPLRRAFS